jgi:DNA-binding MurR/RpiR family transcriptional regulator
LSKLNNFWVLKIKNLDFEPADRFVSWFFVADKVVRSVFSHHFQKLCSVCAIINKIDSFRGGGRFLEKLSDAEMYSWNFLEENKPKVQRSSITQMAELGHVSTATIVRTLKKQGFEGFSDYKNSLKRENGRERKREVRGLSEEANAFVYKNIEEVLRTIDLLDADDLTAVARLIHEAENIMTVARGAAEGVMDDTTHRLQTIGKNAIARYYDNMTMYAERLTERDLMLVVSTQGSEEIILSAAKKAKSRGAKIVALTGNYQSPLAQISDYHLLAYQSRLEQLELYGDAESIMTLEMVSRILLDLYGVYKEKGTIKD